MFNIERSLELRPLIVIPCFKRHQSLRRLLRSIEQSILPDHVEIILSLDGGYSTDVLNVAKDFQKGSNLASVNIVTRDTNIGLREHILWCGDQVEMSEAVIVLEDDLVVDPQFYEYARSAAEFYEKEETIAGIALYSQEYNEYAELPFNPLVGGHSCYFMKVACSWGQLWTKNQWKLFRLWYSSVSKLDIDKTPCLPQTVKNWPESSWKKYFSAYLVQTNKYFVYPYHTYSTNVSDEGGTHIQNGSNLLQSSLRHPLRRIDEFQFGKLADIDSVRYDSFMEPDSQIIFDHLGFSRDSLGIDCYGIKPIEILKKYSLVLTSRWTKQYTDSFPINFRPFEQCLLQKSPANSSLGYLYLVSSQSLTQCEKTNKFDLLEYLSGVTIASLDNLFPFVRKFLSLGLRRIISYKKALITGIASPDNRHEKK